jgi:arsenate reductase
MRTLELPDSIEKREIKTKPLTVKELEMLHGLSGSYEALFSKRAKLYKERGLKDEQLSEDDIRYLILEHYTFLKRPVLVFNDSIFIGNSPVVVEAAKNAIHNGQ